MAQRFAVERISAEMRDCITHCSDCHAICLDTARHCLGLGGSHADAAHIMTLLDCAQICDTSRDFMLRGSEIHGQTCALCAEVCTRCADSCENHPDADEQMRRCAEECRRCADACRAMAA